LRTSHQRCKVGKDSSPAAGLRARERGGSWRTRADLEVRPTILTRLCLALLLLCAALLIACRRDMQDQPKYIPLRPTSFFDDGRSARPLVEGTVARGHLDADSAFYTGKIDNKPVETLPIPITRALLDRGQERFNIYCAPCHDLLGTGKGMIFRRGFNRPPPQSYHIDRLRQAPVGYFFDVITNGLGAMPDYAAQIEPRDRWAIVAYVRVLQLSQNASLNDVPPEARAALAKGGAQ
jgi:mono/diheme cytochrome c family protein